MELYVKCSIHSGALMQRCMQKSCSKTLVLCTVKKLRSGVISRKVNTFYLQEYLWTSGVLI